MGNAASDEGGSKNTSYTEQLTAAVEFAMGATGRKRKQRIVQLIDLMIGSEEFAALCATHPEFRATVISKAYEFHLELATGEGDEGDGDIADTLRIRVVQFMCEHCPELL